MTTEGYLRSEGPITNGGLRTFEEPRQASRHAIGNRKTSLGNVQQDLDSRWLTSDTSHPKIACVRQIEGQS